MATLKDLSSKVAEVMEITKKDAETAVRTTFSALAELMKTEEVSIPGFGKFSVVERAARTGKNPQTGEVIEIAACMAPKFKAGKNLKEYVQEN